MAVEQLDAYTYAFPPGPIDIHTHPRVMDARTQDAFDPLNEGTEGKAGLRLYTEVALESGMTAMILMPNEIRRRFAPELPLRTETRPWPLSNVDRVEAVQNHIYTEAVIPTGIHYGVDPSEIFHDEAREHLNEDLLHQRFSVIGDEVMGLKLFGDETTGGYNVHPKHIPRIIEIWNMWHPDKPVILHLEDENVGSVLRDMNRRPKGKDIPLHIAHVSSREELEAIIEAKQAGMNITCEVTVHHLFLDGTVRDELGGYGCMKPSLKTQDDIDFLWANMKWIDIIASDCAPHRRSDKEAPNPAYGVATHTVMLPLLFGAIMDSTKDFTMDDLYQKLCVTPRQRFNLPVEDGSALLYSVRGGGLRTQPEKYGFNPFPMTQQKFPMVGRVVGVLAGESTLIEPKVSYSHLLRPHIGRLAASQN